MKHGWRFSWLDNFLLVICHHKPPVGVFVQMNLGKAYKLQAIILPSAKKKKDL